jgi:hypothetical protein
MYQVRVRALVGCCFLVAMVLAPSTWAADLSIKPADIEVTPCLSAPGLPSQPFPVLIETGKPVEFRATIANRGNGPAVSTYAEIDVNRYPVGEGQEPIWVGVIARLRLAGHQQVTLPFTPGRNQPPAFVPKENGVYIATVNVDPEKTVQEDRANNLAGLPLQAVPCTATPVLPDLVCSDRDQLLVTTDREPNTHLYLVPVGQQVKFVVAPRLEGAGPYCGYVEVEVNPRGAKPNDPPLWHGVFSFVDLKAGGAARGLARARPEDGLPEFWTPDKPGEYIVGAVADPGHETADPQCFLARGDLLEPPGKDTFFAKETERDDVARNGNNAVFWPLVVHPPRQLALWVWNGEVLTQQEEQSRLFALCRQKGLNLLFVNVGHCFQPAETPGAGPRVTNDQLAQFLRAAHARGLEVHGLEGDPHWALAAEHATVVARLTRALEYNQTAPVQDRLDGFQFDIEPYALPSFQTAERESLLCGFLDLIASLCKIVNCRQPTFALGMAVPFWMDGESESSRVTWQERSQSFAFHAIDQLDTIAAGYLAVMAYRDFTEGPDGSVQHATEEVKYVHERAGKVRVFVGQETAEAKGDPEKTTFFEEGSAALDKAVKELMDTFRSYPRFAGVAIHHYDSYKRWFDTLTIQGPASGTYTPPRSTQRLSSSLNSCDMAGGREGEMHLSGEEPVTTLSIMRPGSPIIHLREGSRTQP